MIRRPPRSTLDRSSAASDVYKRQDMSISAIDPTDRNAILTNVFDTIAIREISPITLPVSYTHLRAHETVLDLVCRLLLEKKKNSTHYNSFPTYNTKRQHSHDLVFLTLTRPDSLK